MFGKKTNVTNTNTAVGGSVSVNTNAVGIGGSVSVNTNTGSGSLSEVERLMARVDQIAQGQDRAELLARLDEIRAYLKDGSVSKEQAKSAYADLFQRISKYAPGAKDIIELFASLHQHL